MLRESSGNHQELCSSHRMYSCLQGGTRKNYLSNTTDINLEVFGESTPELRTKRKLAAQQDWEHRARKANPKDSNGREFETITFISGTAERTSEETPCCSTTPSWAWSSCRSVLCCIMTCGHRFQRDSDCYLPCAHPTESSTDDIKIGENGHPPISPASISPKERNKNHSKKSEMGGSFSYTDVKLKGVPVPLFSNISSSQQHTETESCYKEPLPEHNSKRDSVEKPPLSFCHRGSDEYYSFHESDLEFELSGSMSGTEIDILIFRKLTELFTVHQIDELAKCTSDTVFLEKTNKISDLISSITQDYNLDEQDAECRLVRGIIRISTRKSRTRPCISKNPAIHSQENKVSQGVVPDSGNETMIESFTTSQDDLDVQISEETASDMIARRMRPYSAPGSPVGKDDSFQDTETDSSGAPLLKVYC